MKLGSTLTFNPEGRACEGYRRGGCRKVRSMGKGWPVTLMTLRLGTTRLRMIKGGRDEEGWGVGV